MGITTVSIPKRQSQRDKMMGYWHFPLKKQNVWITNNSVSFIGVDFATSTEIPIGPHPGSFGFVRKHHTHEGVDLYCNDADDVMAVEDGVITSIVPFTGEIAGSSWWHNTYAVMVQGETGTVCYGEINPLPTLHNGQTIKCGQLVGNVTKVLKVDKGRPMHMLHLEVYSKYVTEPISLDHVNEKPVDLTTQPFLNPTAYLVMAAADAGIFKQGN